MRVRALDVLELEDNRGLFGGRDLGTGEKVTFHLRGGNAARMADRIQRGERVELEVPGG